MERSTALTNKSTYLSSLESRGDYDRAAGWAFFCGLTERAIEALKSERGSGHDGKY